MTSTVLTSPMYSPRLVMLLLSVVLFLISLVNFVQKAHTYRSYQKEVNVLKSQNQQFRVFFPREKFGSWYTTRNNNNVSDYHDLDKSNNGDETRNDDNDENSFPRHWHRRRRLQHNEERANLNRHHDQKDDRNPPLRVLYIVTSLSAVDTGYRSTTEGYDRFGKTLVPVISESVQSMMTETTASSSLKLDVAVYLIAHYEITPIRYQQLKQALPAQAPLYVWSNATPYGYDKTKSSGGIEYVMSPRTTSDNHRNKLKWSRLDMITRALSRQHRFVIKDLIDQYDMFVTFEDDMLIKGSHVQQYYHLTQHLFQLRNKAPESIPMLKKQQPQNLDTLDDSTSLFYGPMTKAMLRRVFPGFMRVEVVPSIDWEPPPRRTIHGVIGSPQIPIDYRWNNSYSTTAMIDPSICCHRSSSSPLVVEQVRFWETAINALHIRQMPDQSWVLLQAGNNESIYQDHNYKIGRFWTGQNHELDYFGDMPIEERRPKCNDGDYINNQGGWMATRRQILEWHSEQCVGGFLPPYSPQDLWRNDGVANGIVEFWSGGIQLVGANACNLQRIVPLEPMNFSASLLYHTSNNKQKSGPKIQQRFAKTNIQEFWGQLNTVRQNAQQQKQQELEELKALLRQQGNHPNQ